MSYFPLKGDGASKRSTQRTLYASKFLVNIQWEKVVYRLEYFKISIEHRLFSYGQDNYW